MSVHNPYDDADLQADVAAVQVDVAGLDGEAMRGTDNAALAAVATEARLAELDAANIPTDLATIEQEVFEIDGHIHNRERWCGISADQSGNDWCLPDSLNPFVVASGNGDFGTAIKVIGTDNTPLITGDTKFDPHMILITDLENATPWIVRVIYGTGTSGDAVTAGQYTEFMLAAANAGPPVRPGGVARGILMPRLDAGTDKVWVSVKNATNLDEMEFFVGTHGYVR